VARAVSAACNETVNRLNAPGSAIQKVDRINRSRSHFRRRYASCSMRPQFCRASILPLHAWKKVQRSGLSRLAHRRSGEQARLLFGPKLYAAVRPRQQFPGVLFELRKSTTKCATAGCADGGC
jgi:hypothetical protein